VSLASRNFGAGLRTLGFEPMSLDTAKSIVNSFVPIEGPNALVIFEETCAEWTIACIGAFTQSITVATSYSTLGMNAVAEALNETSAPAILCNLKDVERVAKSCGEQCAKLQTIIYTTNYCTEDEVIKQSQYILLFIFPDIFLFLLVPDNFLIFYFHVWCLVFQISKGHPDKIGRLNIVSMANVIAAGASNPCDMVEPSPDHIGLIMYTSGSTGKPKVRI
jgi:long-subunit acyl-CoA synthetase (AMP-forming)